MPLPGRDRHQRGGERHRLVHPVGALSEHRRQLVQLRLRRIVAPKARGALEPMEDRVERRMDVVGRAEIAEARVRLGVEALA
jgi:hypothetical protein